MVAIRFLVFIGEVERPLEKCFGVNIFMIYII